MKLKNACDAGEARSNRLSGTRADTLFPVQLGADCKLGIPFGTDDARAVSSLGSGDPQPPTILLA